MTTFRKGPRVTLRLVTEADVPKMVEYLNDPAVSENLTVYKPVSESAERDYLIKISRADSVDIVLALEVNNEFVGMMGIHGIDHRNGTATTGAWIGRPFQGKGFGPEAKMLLLEYAFNTLNLRKVCSNVYEFNEPSLKYSAKCGYQVEGRLRKQYYARGQYWDRVQLAVFREDFLPLWEKFKQEHAEHLLTS